MEVMPGKPQPRAQQLKKEKKEQEHSHTPKAPEMDVKFPKSVCGTAETFSVLALVCPDQSYNMRFPLLVGTNVLRRLIQDCRKVGGDKYLSTLPIHTNWIAAYTACGEKLKTCNREGKAVPVRLCRKKPVIILKNDTCEVTGIRHTKVSGKGGKAILEEPERHAVPGALVVSKQLIQVKPRSHSKVKVVICNVSNHSVTLQPKRVIAECMLVDWVKAVKADMDSYSPNNPKTEDQLSTLAPSKNTSQDSPGDLNFENSPVSEELKSHIKSRINKEASKAFARHNLDVGHVSSVAHSIELVEHVPFIGCTRRISPTYFEDLRRHLQELLATGIIKESNSLYASPVVLVRKKNGDLRMVIDYRKLNNLTKKDAYPLPRRRRHSPCCQVQNISPSWT
ncbi:hypothetical protein SKAU_G00092990 [Synaphobranchus kaupii]|uniref:Uncharacterized protein n=1 Tax=Synaphobranchus kaupii TaxID=118154 RepID=A0A9Q1J6M5_SYNKA|nr:hypothetical protein SKAU_G00092990 [Synaphobranchus kaupii]